MTPEAAVSFHYMPRMVIEVYTRLITVTLAALLSLPVLAQVELTGAWVRALPPTQTSTAAYLTVAYRR